MRFSSLLLVSALDSLARSAIVTYIFNVTWVTKYPDHAFSRPVIGINNQWPIPQIDVVKGDRLIVNVENQLGNQSTSLHLHGLYQNGSTTMDGPVGVIQCGIQPGQRFTYNMKVPYARLRLE